MDLSEVPILGHNADVAGPELNLTGPQRPQKKTILILKLCLLDKEDTKLYKVAFVVVVLFLFVILLKNLKERRKERQPWNHDDDETGGGFDDSAMVIVVLIILELLSWITHISYYARPLVWK